MENRLFFLDAGRAIAISLVTGFHLWRYFGSPHYYIGPFDLYGILANGLVGVELFFVISGYAIMMTWQKQNGEWKQRTKKFLIARLLRLYPAYVVAIIVWILLIQQGIATKPTGIRDIATHITFTHTFFKETFFSISGVMWSLAVEVHFYLLFPFIICLPLSGRFIIVLASAIYTVFLYYFTPNIGYVWMWSIVAFLPLFLLGMAIYSVKNILLSSSKLFVPMLILATALLSLKAGHELNLPLRIITGAILGMTILGLMDFKQSKTISIIGQGSYSIYLYNYIYNITPSPVIEGTLGFVLYFISVMLFGLLMNRLIDVPNERIRHQLISRRVAPPKPSL